MTLNDGPYGSSSKDQPRTPPRSGLHGKRGTSIVPLPGRVEWLPAWAEGATEESDELIDRGCIVRGGLGRAESAGSRLPG